MTLEAIKADIQELTDDEHAHLSAWIGSTEAARRHDAKATSLAVADVVTKMQNAGVIPKPAAATTPPTNAAGISKVPAWVEPDENPAMMYRKGEIVRAGGKVWISEAEGLNSSEPGGDGVSPNVWRDITPATRSEKI